MKLHIWGVAKCFIITLLQIYHWVCQWKNLENRSTFGEVTDKSIVGCFFDSQCTFTYILAAEGLESLTWEAKENVAVDRWIRPATTKHQPLLSPTTSSGLLYVESYRVDGYASANGLLLMTMMIIVAMLLLIVKTTLDLFRMMSGV